MLRKGLFQSRESFGLAPDTRVESKNVEAEAPKLRLSRNLGRSCVPVKSGTARKRCFSGQMGPVRLTGGICRGDLSDVAQHSKAWTAARFASSSPAEGFRLISFLKAVGTGRQVA
jgi:hypothetical protein